MRGFVQKHKSPHKHTAPPRNFTVIDNEAQKKHDSHSRESCFVCGEDEIRTRGTLIRYVGLANRWFQPLTHLSVWPFYPKGCANIDPFLELTKLIVKKIYFAAICMAIAVPIAHGITTKIGINSPSIPLK